MLVKTAINKDSADNTEVTDREAIESSASATEQVSGETE
jgi:hypothetical protein